MIGIDGHSAEHARRLSRFLKISLDGLTGPIHGRVVGGVAEKHGDVVCLTGGRVDALCVAGVRRCRSTSSEVRLAHMALKRGISHVTVRRRLARGEVCGGEGVDGRVAYLIAVDVWGETIRVVVVYASWHAGEDVLGRVGTGVRRVGGGRGERV